MERCCLVLVALGIALAGCSGAGAEDATASAAMSAATFPDQPGAIATSAKNDLTVSLYSLPNPSLVRGSNRIQLEVEGLTDPDLDIELETYMPAMGHGPSQQPELIEVSANRYTFEKVVLHMPGMWELRVRFSGQLRDELVFEFDVD